jgi:signal transduction histidine kinase
MNNKQPEKGIVLCIEGITMAQKFRLHSKLPILYDALAENYKAAGDFEKYSETLSMIIALKDSLYEKNAVVALAEMQAKYDAQKKENIIAQQKFALIKKNYWLYGSLIVMLFAAIAAYFIFKNYIRKQQIKLLLMLEKEKRTAEKAVMDAEENERKRIAADLHDNLGAYAASIASNIDHIKVSPDDTGNVVAMQELRNNSRSIVSQLNDTIWVLKKDALSLTAISDRLKIFIQRIQSSYPHIKIDVFENIAVDQLLPPSQAFHLFHVLQEAINNAVRHSGGKQINVDIESDKVWKITVSDDGKGMGVASINKEGNGLLNMKNRSREAEWAIEWQPNFPSGTQLIITPTTN